MRRAGVIGLLLLASVASAVDKKGTIEELKARLETEKPKDQIELAVVIAERQLDATDAAYTAGKTDEAQKALKDVLDYGVRAAKQAVEIHKRMKQTEIALRRISDRLEDISKSLDVDSRPPVQDARRKLEAARNDLLFRMFK